MAALTADRATPMRDGEQFEYPMAATTEIFMGSLVVLDASGNAEPGTTAAGKVAVGRADEYVNNTGAAAAANVKVRAGTFKWVNSSGDPVTKANIGDTVYIEDDQTVCATATGKSQAGIMVQIDTDGVWVYMRPPVALAAGLTAANNLSDVGTVATARSNLGLSLANKESICMRVTNLVAASAKVYRAVAPHAGTIDLIYSVLEEAALAAGDATLTFSIDGTPVTGGVITIAQAGSAAGDVDTVSPSAAKTVAAGSVIECTVGGANTDANAFADVTLTLTTA